MLEFIVFFGSMAIIYEFRWSGIVGLLVLWAIIKAQKEWL